MYTHATENESMRAKFELFYIFSKRKNMILHPWVCFSIMMQMIAYIWKENVISYVRKNYGDWTFVFT